jgi:predicted methyltransferase
MTILDLLGGAGYYSEILARVAGPDGKVYLHNNQGYRGLMRDLPRRLQGTGLDALEIYVREIEDINLRSGSVDLVLMVKVYHDLYYVNNGWAVGPDPVFETVHRILKPGGTLAVIDHRAPDGTGAGFAQNLHRIAPDFARQDIEARCFRFAGASNVLANQEDDLSRSPFVPELRGRTDRFLHRYTKVECPSAIRAPHPAQ